MKQVSRLSNVSSTSSKIVAKNMKRKMKWLLLIMRFDLNTRLELKTRLDCKILAYIEIKIRNKNLA